MDKNMDKVLERRGSRQYLYTNYQAASGETSGITAESTSCSFAAGVPMRLQEVTYPRVPGGKVRMAF
jgi:hypothetical protein